MNGTNSKAAIHDYILPILHFASAMYKVKWTPNFQKSAVVDI